MLPLECVDAVDARLCRRSPSRSEPVTLFARIADRRAARSAFPEPTAFPSFILSSNTQQTSSSKRLKMLGGIVHGFVGIVRSILSNLTDPPLNVSGSYAILRHSPSLVFYQGAGTTVVFSIWGTSKPSDRRAIFLQRRGWITGVLGWDVGGYFGGTWSKGVEVTPERSIGWMQESGEDITGSGDVDADKAQSDGSAPPLPVVRKRKLRGEVERFAPPDGMSYLETLVIHIPSSAVDGYYRIVSLTKLSCATQ